MHRIARLLLAFVPLAAVAWAHAAALPPITVLIVDPTGSRTPAAEAPGLIPPTDLGTPRACDAYYPTHVAPAEGTTRLQFRISERGDVSHVFILGPSGTEALDIAATSCISAWKFRPAEFDGRAVGVQAATEIRWLAAMAETARKPDPAVASAFIGRSVLPPRSAGAPHVCLQYYPVEALNAAIQGQTMIDFTITPAGTVIDVRVTRSSGNDALDEAAKFCARQWFYAPATEDGRPVAVPWRARVDWVLR